jgi:hypothetical protein
MAYVYKMVQIPQNIQVDARNAKDAAANYVEGEVNRMAASGWEFHRIDQIGVLESPGCLAALLGGKANYISYSVISFRKET